MSDRHTTRTLASAFRQLEENLALGHPTAAEIDVRCATVAKVVSRHMKVMDTFAAGSVVRGTAIAPAADAPVDVFLVLNPAYYELGPGDLLVIVCEALRGTYPKSPRIDADGHSIAVTFTDFPVHVYPCFQRSDGGYLLAHSRGRTWLNTDPKVHNKRFAEVDDFRLGKVAPIMRMVRAWNRTLDGGFQNFYLDLLAMSTFIDEKVASETTGLQHFFAEGANHIEYMLPDPAGYGVEVAGLKHILTVETAMRRFATARDQAALALRYEQQGKIQLAFAEWRALLGTVFPAYG